MADMDDFDEALEGLKAGRYDLTLTPLGHEPGYELQQRTVHVHVRPREGYAWPGFGEDLNHHFMATRSEAQELGRFGAPWSMQPKSPH